MTDRAQVLETAIAKNREYLAKKDALVYAEKIIRYSSELDALERLADAQAAADDAAHWSGTYDEAYDRLLDGADELLQAAGRPYGRDGAERGALDRATYIKLATDLGVLDELGGEDFFGPDGGPDVKT